MLHQNDDSEREYCKMGFFLFKAFICYSVLYMKNYNTFKLNYHISAIQEYCCLHYIKSSLKHISNWNKIFDYFRIEEEGERWSIYLLKYTSFEN